MIQLELDFMFPEHLDEIRIDFPSVQFDIIRVGWQGTAIVLLTGERDAVEAYVLEYTSGDAEDTADYMALVTEVQA